MKEQRRVNEALSKIYKEELSSEKVELSLVNDIDKAIREITEVAQEKNDIEVRIAKAFQLAKPLESKAKSVVSDASRLISEVERAAKDLGVSPSDIGKLDTLKKRLPLAEKISGFSSKISKAL